MYVIYKVNHVKSKYSKITTEISGIVTNIEKDDNKTKINIKAKENILVYYYSKIKLNLGDKIKVKGSLEPFNNNTIFNLFNYKKYMLSKNTYYKMNTKKIEVLKRNKNIFYKIKSTLIKRINKIKRKEYLYAFIMGDTSYMNDNVLEKYRVNGISHLFAISGMHITLISSILLIILNKIKKTNFNYIIVILFLLFYLFLTNFTPSIIRAISLFIFLFFNKIFKLNLSGFKILLIILLNSLLFNPYNIYNIGFIFSYVISLYLIKFSNLIKTRKTYISKIFMTSFLAFILGIPVMINNYFSINLLSIVNNLIFVPLVSIIVFPFSIIVLFIPKLDIIYNYIINILEFLSDFMINMKIELILKKVNIIFIIIYFMLITFILYKFTKRKYQYLIILIVSLIIHNNINYIYNSFITFLDVRQGDSTLLHIKNNDILIDTGGIYNYSLINNIVTYLKSEGIKKLEYLIITHGDYDHVGEAINLVNNFKVEKVIFNCGEFNDLEKKLIKVLDKKKIKYYSCIKELNIDKNKLYFLQTKEYDNENDNSNVIYTELNGYKFMFMGDASITTEKDILDKYNLSDIDVLKVGHHGSKTSSGRELIDEINPKYSIISVGKNNRYGHPNREVLNNLEDSKIYRTDQDGSIMFKIKNNKLKIETCSP